MADDARFSRVWDERQLTAAAAVRPGDVWQLPDGAAAVNTDSAAAAAGDRTAWKTSGTWVVPKAASVVCLDGGRAYWDHSANAVTPLKPQSGRGFLVGSFVGDAAAADETCAVNLNAPTRYAADLRDGVWVTEATDGLGVTPLAGGGVRLAFDAVNEAAQAAVYSERTFPVASNPILECRFAVFDAGDDAALDWNVGLASGSHATDFGAVAEQVTVHGNGNALDLFAESDDGTTDVAETDTTVNLTDDAYAEVWIDARNPAAVAVYVNAVRVLPGTTFTLAAAAGPLRAIAHMEKTADDTSADLRIDFLRVRTSEQ